MALQAGQLLISRRQLTLAAGANTIDTLLTQINKGMDPDPTLAARTMVIVMPPAANWANITIPSDPTFNTVTGTVEVVLVNGGAETTVNVLFWAPHTSVGPVSVDSYVIG